MKFFIPAIVTNKTVMHQEEMTNRPDSTNQRKMDSDNNDKDREQIHSGLMVNQASAKYVNLFYILLETVLINAVLLKKR